MLAMVRRHWPLATAAVVGLCCAWWAFGRASLHDGGPADLPSLLVVRTLGAPVKAAALWLQLKQPELPRGAAFAVALLVGLSPYLAADLLLAARRRRAARTHRDPEQAG